MLTKQPTDVAARRLLMHLSDLAGSVKRLTIPVSGRTDPDEQPMDDAEALDHIRNDALRMKDALDGLLAAA